MSTFSEIIDKEQPVLVDFFATWCGPCQTLAPILKQVKDELGDRVAIIKIDVDKNQTLAAQFQVRGVPTLVLFKKRKTGLAAIRTPFQSRSHPNYQPARFAPIKKLSRFTTNTVTLLSKKQNVCKPK